MPSTLEVLSAEYNAPPQVKASELFPDLMDEVDKRIADAMEKSVDKIKIWVLTSLVVYILGLVAGIGTLSYHAGGIRAEIRSSNESNTSQDEMLLKRSKWSTRKDVIDDSLVQAIRRYHPDYEPPRWYTGRDAEETGI